MPDLRDYCIDIQRISFKGTMQHLSSLAPYLAIADQPGFAVLYGKLISRVAKEKIPDRPDRGPSSVAPNPFL